MLFVVCTLYLWSEMSPLCSSRPLVSALRSSAPHCCTPGHQLDILDEGKRKTEDEEVTDLSLETIWTRAVRGSEHLDGGGGFRGLQHEWRCAMSAALHCTALHCTEPRKIRKGCLDDTEWSPAQPSPAPSQPSVRHSRQAQAASSQETKY